MGKRTVNPDRIRNNFERQVFKDLRSCQRKLKFEVEYESVVLPYTLRREYIPDFVVTLPSGKTLFIETKGYLRPDDRAKLLSARECNPEADIRIVFMQDNKIHKSSKTRYSDWASKHGFKFAFGNVPQEWLSE